MRYTIPAAVLLHLLAWSASAQAQVRPTPQSSLRPAAFQQGEPVACPRQADTEVVPPAPSPATTPTPGIPGREDLQRTGSLPFGMSPKPNAETEAKFARFIDRTIDAENILELIEGRPRTILLKQTPFRIQIANEEIAAATMLEDDQMSIMGQLVGSTMLNLWFNDPENPDEEIILSYLVRVLPDPEIGLRLERIFKALEQEINRSFPDSVVRLSLVGDRILVQGQARDIEEATQILRIVSQSIPGGEDVAPFDPYASFAGGFGALAYTGFNQGAFDDASNQFGVNASQINSRIINMLRVPGEHQVMLKVTVADVSRNAMRSIGADLEIGDMTDAAASFFTLLPTVEAGGTFMVNRGDFELAITALRSLGLARTLAEPNLVTLNGQPATFQAGNAFPRQQVSGFTASGLEGAVFSRIGVQLQFLPVITDKDRIRLTVTSFVTEIDQENFNESGNPSLDQRGFSTVVELRDGETLAVAGLVQNTYETDSDRVPLLGDIPVLGQLFSTNTSELDERELVILVTPHLVAPWGVGTDKPPVAGFDLIEPTDVEFYLLGRIEGYGAEDYRSTIRTDINRMRAVQQCQRRIIIGPSGHSRIGY